MSEDVPPAAPVQEAPPPSPVEVARQVLAADRARRLGNAKQALDNLIHEHGVDLVAYVIPAEGPDGSVVCSPAVRLELRP
jgi:pyruvate/2-oxoglutarate dehydrogenase complex dihydrolipoamide acyltransferase (E2) component